MSLLSDLDTPKLTSSLNDVVNDTGRVAFCGPFVLSAITGYPVSSVEAEIRAYRGELEPAPLGVASAEPDTPIFDASDAARGMRDASTRRLATGQPKAPIKGTYTEDVRAALAHFGYRMDLKESFMHFERKKRPSVWTWMQKPRNAWAHHILAIHKGKEGHWILIKGVKLCDTYSLGKWQFVSDGPHKGARIMEIFEVRKNLGV